MADNLQILIQTCIELGSAKTLETLGISSGEISQRKARDTYHKWFVDADRAGRIRPCRIEDGKSGTRWYRVVDILALKAQDAARAELKYLNLYTMKAIKKITEVILTIIASIALLMMTAEAETIGMQAICTLGSIAVLLVSCKLIKKIDPDLFKEEEI